MPFARGPIRCATIAGATYQIRLMYVIHVVVGLSSAKLFELCSSCSR